MISKETVMKFHFIFIALTAKPYSNDVDLYKLLLLEQQSQMCVLKKAIFYPLVSDYKAD